jgi:hypothetical protein
MVSGSMRYYMRVTWDHVVEYGRCNDAGYRRMYYLVNVVGGYYMVTFSNRSLKSKRG